jgi:hypothetical protein
VTREEGRDTQRLTLIFSVPAVGERLHLVRVSVSLVGICLFLGCGAFEYVRRFVFLIFEFGDEQSERLSVCVHDSGGSHVMGAVSCWKCCSFRMFLMVEGRIRIRIW